MKCDDGSDGGAGAWRAPASSTPPRCTVSVWGVLCRRWLTATGWLTVVTMDTRAPRQRGVLRTVVDHLVRHPIPAAAAAAEGATQELAPIGLHGPLPSPAETIKYLRPKEEWSALAEADATKWFTNHRGKPGLPLLEDDYLFQHPDHPCIVPYLPPGHSATDKRTAVLIMPGGGRCSRVSAQSAPPAALALHHRLVLTTVATVATHASQGTTGWRPLRALRSAVGVESMASSALSSGIASCARTRTATPSGTRAKTHSRTPLLR